jgi:hypothetical protein
LKTLLPGIITSCGFGLVAGGLSYLTSGDSLGFYLGPVVLAGIVVPPIAAGAPRARSAIFAAGAFLDAIGLIWLIPVFELGFGHLVNWIQCYLTLGAFVLALCGAAWLSRRLVGPTLGAAVIVMLALAWLLWPGWLSPYLSGDTGAAVVAWLSPAHPLLTINRVMLDLGAWTQQRLMYQYTALGQDVPLSLPRTVIPCVAVHAATGLALLWVGNLKLAKRSVESSMTPVRGS